MTFQEILAAVLDDTPGALAGAIMGNDGIPLQEYAREPGRVDLPSVAVEFQSVLEQARKVAASLDDGGELQEFILMTSQNQLLFRQIDDEYFVVIALEPTGSLGKARYLIRSLLNDLREGL